MVAWGIGGRAVRYWRRLRAGASLWQVQLVVTQFVLLQLIVSAVQDDVVCQAGTCMGWSAPCLLLLIPKADTYQQDYDNKQTTNGTNDNNDFFLGDSISVG